MAESVGVTRARLEVPADYHLRMTVRLTGPSATFALTMRQRARPSDCYRLEVRPAKGEATLAGFKTDFPRPVGFVAGEDIRLEAFVQGSLIECFVNDRHAFSGRAYTNADGALDMLVTGGKAEVRELVVRTAPPREAK